MIERLSFGKDREISERNLDEKIEKAFKSALTEDEYSRKLEEFRSLCKRRDQEELSADEESRYQTLDRELDDCEIRVSSIMEYKRLMELVPVPQQEIYQTLSHENAHANVAEQVPSRKFVGYILRFRKDETGKVQIFPLMESREDTSFSEKQRLEERIRVMEAPLVYDKEGILSVEDKNNIKEAKRRLSEIEE